MNNVLLVRVLLAFRIFTPYSIYSGVPSLYDFNHPGSVQTFRKFMYHHWMFSVARYFPPRKII